MGRLAILGFAALSLGSTPAVAQQNSPVALATGGLPVARTGLDGGVFRGLQIPRALVEQDYRVRLARLRQAALKQRIADGGTLTPESYARLQARLDKLNKNRERDIKFAGKA